MTHQLRELDPMLTLAYAALDAQGVDLTQAAHAELNARLYAAAVNALPALLDVVDAAQAVERALVARSAVLDDGHWRAVDVRFDAARHDLREALARLQEPARV